MKNKNIIMAGVILSVALLVSCGTRTDRGVMESENTRNASDRVNTSTTPNRTNTTTQTTTRTTTPTTESINNTAASSRVNQNEPQNQANTNATDLKNTPTTDRLHESATSKQHMDNNATINRRNENTNIADRMDRLDEMHYASNDDKVQQTAAENSRRVLYTRLNMTQDQIQKLESMMHDKNNAINQGAQKKSLIDRQLRMDKYFKEILNEEQFKGYEKWKSDNPNTRF